ncbi:fibronectin type III domain-containing protein, partial [Haloferula rosea]
QSVRLRFNVSVSGHAPEALVRLDKLTIAEMPEAVLALPIDQIGTTSMRLNWTPSTLPGFTRYRIYRSTTSTVTTASPLIAEFDQATTDSYIDTGLSTRTTYYYKVFTVDDRDTHSPSGLMTATTLGLPIPLEDDFESGFDGWTVTGEWQVFEGVGRGGGMALVDSPGDYLASTDTTAQFAVNLAGMNWPVLRFWDKHAFAGGSWGRIEFSTDGTSWGNALYGVTGIRTEWRQQAIDLSKWKNQERLFIRFRRATDGNVADGWTIDDLSIGENPNAPIYPVWDGFESESGLWLNSRWATVNDDPREGSGCLHDTPEGRYAPSCEQRLVLAHELDLTSAVDPKLSFFLRGNLAYQSWFRVQLSTDGGLTWGDLSSLNLNYTYDQPDWRFLQVSLAPWMGQQVRLSFVTSGSNNQPTSNILIDSIGIGEEPPGAPSPLSPIDQNIVPELRPILTTVNAVDPQSDPLTYRFEVYADAALTQLVAQVPAVASGSTTTSWRVDVNLPDNAFYWWRCRADDGDDTGPWSSVASFAVNEINNPPNEVQPVTPLNGGTLYSLTELLIWRTTDDPDPGDSILDYHLEIDDDGDFSSPLVTVEGITVSGVPDEAGHLVGLPLDQLAGIESIRAGGWLWRIRARDSRFGYGPWSTATASFRIVSDYERWVVDHFTPAERLDPEISGPEVDDDGDGIPRIIEFACGMDMNISSIEGAPEMRYIMLEGERHLAFEFDRKIGTDLVFRLQSSSRLDFGWKDTGAAVEVIGPIDSVRERCRLTDPLAIGEFSRRFLRVEVDLP